MYTVNRNDEELKVRLRTNLERTFELIQLHQGLKFSLFKKLHPEKNDDEIIQLISRARLMRQQA